MVRLLDMHKRKRLYEYFVDERNVDKIENPSDSAKLSIQLIAMVMDSVITTFFPTFTGYNFLHIFPRVIFLFQIFFGFLLIRRFVIFINFDRKYHIFKKRYMPYLFTSLLLLLVIVFWLLPIWTTHFIILEDGAFIVNFNPAFYFFIFIPVLFLYGTFCVYAFNAFFVKYGAFGTRKGISTNFRR